MHIIVWVVTSRLTLGSLRMPHDTIMLRFWPVSRVSYAEEPIGAWRT